MASKMFSVAWITSVQSATKVGYDAAHDPRATADDVSAREADRLVASQNEVPQDEIDEDLPSLAVGDYLTDGREALTFATSVGNGRGSTKVELPATEIGDAYYVLDSFDPDEDLGSLSVAQCIKRTIGVEDVDGVPSVTFKVSLAKHARTVIVPLSDWQAFLNYVHVLDGAALSKIAEFREIQAAEEAAKAAAAAKAANK